MLSEACKNAIRAVVFLATEAGDTERKTVKEIASAIRGPHAFVAKVMQDLSRQDIISSAKGPNGGMYLTPKQTRQNIMDIVAAIDGLDAFTSCGLGLPRCSASAPCPVHDSYALLRDNLLATYKQTTIKELAVSVKSGTAVLHV